MAMHTYKDCVLNILFIRSFTHFEGSFRFNRFLNRFEKPISAFSLEKVMLSDLKFILGRFSIGKARMEKKCVAIRKYESGT